MSTIYQVDSFSDGPFKGNPAGVMILENYLADEFLQSIAAEMNLSETAFLVQVEDDKYKIRFFTPTKEIPLCGHATLASAHILFELNLVDKNNYVTFETIDSKVLTAKNIDGKIVMQFPAYELYEVDFEVETLKKIGITPKSILKTTNDWLLVEAESESELKNIKVDSTYLTENGLGQLILTSKSDSSEFDFSVRCFCPDLGIFEDPVTGSIQCALVPYWAEKLGKSSFSSIQLSERSGVIESKLNQQEVEISGKAFTVFKIETLF
jgi:PhzF family phenazine biosynthesis protein